MSERTAEMPFTMHLEELRTCLVRTLLGILIGAIASYLFIGEIFQILTFPLHDSSPDAVLIGTGPAEAFIVKIKVAIFAGILLSAPLSIYQLWVFISPGLHQHEKRFVIPFVFFASLFFFTGVSFCYSLVLPVALRFLGAEFVDIGISANIKIGEYLSFIVTLLIVFGVLFEIPIISYFLARLNLLSHQWLIRNGRTAIVVIFVVAAVLTPSPDWATQILLAVPLLILYGMSIGIAYYVRRNGKGRGKGSGSELGDDEGKGRGRGREIS